MMTPRDATARRDQQIIALYQCGMRLADIAACYNITGEQARRILESAKTAKPRPSSPFTERNAEIAELRRGGMLLEAIGVRFGITGERARQIVERAGVPKPPPRHAERNAEIIASGRNGATLQAIGEQFGLGRGSVRTILKRAGVPPGRRGLLPGSHNPERDARIAEMRRGGATVQEIGEQYGLHDARVYQILHHAGIRCRLPGPPRSATRVAHSAERDARIVELRRDGMALAAISKQFGLSGSGVRRILKQNGVISRRHAYVERNARIIEMRQGGAKFREIVERFGLSEKTIWDIVHPDDRRRHDAVRRAKRKAARAAAVPLP
jgi:DNA-binding CsgD family transcriptional regulator